MYHSYQEATFAEVGADTKKTHAFGARILFGSKHLTHLEGVL